MLKRGGLDIEWDHGDAQKSREAAEKMVKLFGMAHMAALNSNHIRGRAIDMNISWKEALVIREGRGALPPSRVGRGRGRIAFCTS